MNSSHPFGGVVVDCSHLVDHALSLIARGELPSRPFTAVDAGYGKQEACRLCSQKIASSQVCYRVPAESNAECMAFHVYCYIAWEAAEPVS